MSEIMGCFTSSLRKISEISTRNIGRLKNIQRITLSGKMYTKTLTGYCYMLTSPIPQHQLAINDTNDFS